MAKRTITPASHSAQAFPHKKVSEKAPKELSEKAKQEASDALSERWLQALLSAKTSDSSLSPVLDASSKALKKASKSKKSTSLNKPPFKPHVRKRVVRSGAYYHQYGEFQRRDPFKMYAPVPWIYIKGYWLQEAGFPIGATLTVQVEAGCITIKPERTESVD